MSKVKAYLFDASWGFIFQLIVLFFVPRMGDGTVGIPGSEFIASVIKINSLIVLGFAYTVSTGVAPFIIYILTPWYKKYHERTLRHLFFSFLFFSLGGFIVYLIFLFLGILALRNFGF